MPSASRAATPSDRPPKGLDSSSVRALSDRAPLRVLSRRCQRESRRAIEDSAADDCSARTEVGRHSAASPQRTPAYAGRMRRRRYHQPEDLGREQQRRDAADPNRRFFVYVLKTDYGHYVGHTAHVGRRLRQHRDDQVQSTAGGNPSLVWKSSPRATRKDAATFEAVMKSYRDQQSPRFVEIAGVAPVPWRYRRRRAGWSIPASRRKTWRAGRSRRTDSLVPALRRMIWRAIRRRRGRRVLLAMAVVAVVGGRSVVEAIGNALP